LEDGRFLISAQRTVLMGHQPRTRLPRILLLSLIAVCVVLAPAIDFASHSFAPGVASAKNGNGKGHKGKEHKVKGKKNQGENKGKGKKKGHHKIDKAQVTAVLLAQTEPATTPTPASPSESLATTGSILVIAYVCPDGVNLEASDWFATCTSVSPDITFRLVRFADATLHTGTTDDLGNLVFANLDPGTYQLTEENGDWCHAESDSVDENGDVIVRANERSTVWIFHCPPSVPS
jgi:Prealbumin-like fold domain